MKKFHEISRLLEFEKDIKKLLKRLCLLTKKDRKPSLPNYSRFYDTYNYLAFL